MKSLISLVLASLCLFTYIAHAAEPSESHPTPLSLPTPKTSPFVQWQQNAKGILENNVWQYMRYNGDNIWLTLPNDKPFAIFKPSTQCSRSIEPKHFWRSCKSSMNEFAVIYLTKILGLQDMVPINVPITYVPKDPRINHEPVKGSLEFPIFLLKNRIPDYKNNDLNELATLLLKLQTEKTGFSSSSLSLADLDFFIDGNTNQFRVKVIDSTFKKLRIQGSKAFCHHHLKTFNQNINLDSLIKMGLLDMLIYHRDMKPDNVMLWINEYGIHFQAIDFEYAMLPFVYTELKDSHPDSPLKNATKIHYRPFYIFFSHAHTVIPEKYFQAILQIKKENIMLFAENMQQKMNFSFSGIDDFYLRLEWLQSVAKEVIDHQKKDMTLYALHQAFVNHFGLNNKFQDDKAHYNPSRYQYTAEELVILNPNRSSDVELDFNSSHLRSLEDSLIEGDLHLDEENTFKTSSDIVEGYDTVLN